MEFIILALKWTVGPLIGVIITVIMTEPLRDRLLPILTSLGTKSNPSITGKWRANFYFRGDKTSHVEIIEIRKSLGLILGNINPSDENYSALKNVHDQRPIRIRGIIKDNLLFSGTWIHPLDTSHHSGSFLLLVDRNNDKMNGIWLGYSDTKKTIESDRWIWERIPS